MCFRTSEPKAHSHHTQPPSFFCWTIKLSSCLCSRRGKECAFPNNVTASRWARLRRQRAAAKAAVLWETSCFIWASSINLFICQRLMAKLLSIVDVTLDLIVVHFIYIILLSKSNLCSSSKMQNYLPSQSPRNLLATHKTAKKHPKSHSSIQINQSSQLKSNSKWTSQQEVILSKHSQGTLLPS